MGIEIERKFLLKDNSWRCEIIRSELMAQGYLAGAQALHAGLTQCSVRVRRSGEKAWINVKSNVKGIARDEYEYPIPVEDALKMLKDLCGNLVEKIRHHVMVDEAHFEIDEFQGGNQGLILAEIELESIDSTHPQPKWLGVEVSEEGRYYNINLASTPYSSWVDKAN